MICDNKYHILSISDCIAGNHNDSFEINKPTLITTLHTSMRMLDLTPKSSLKI
jgi:hypothetical protein